MQGTYFLCGVVIAALLIWPEETIVAFTAVGLKIQIFYINYRMKFAAWRVYRQLVRLSKEAGWPKPPPFTFVNIWDRESP